MEIKLQSSQTLGITTMNKLSLHVERSSVHHLLDELLLDYRLNATKSESEVTLTLNKFCLQVTILNESKTLC
jgi:two-component system phosphate regulon sensor histidine kinase PhoR